MSRTPVVHVLYACTTYEGSTAVRAFADRAAAHALLSACRAHEEKRPNAPDYSVTNPFPGQDEAFDRWDRAFKRWSAKHPAGKDFASFDSFSVQALPFTP